MASYVEKIKVGTGESWNIRDAEARALIADIWSVIYPVGSIYMSVTYASPAELFGGTWERIEDTFLLASGTSYAAGSIGGEATHTLTVSEMPAHHHDVIRYTNLDDSWDMYGLVEGNHGSAADKYIPGNQVMTAAGGGQAHNNMPPYLAVYMWKRTA